MKKWLLSAKRRIWPVPMSLALAGSFGILTGVSVALVLYISVKTNFENTFSLLNDKSIILVKSLQDGLTNQLNPVKMAVSRMKQLYDKGELELRDTTRLHDFLSGAVVASPAVEAWIVYDTDFVQRGIFSDENGKLIPFKEERESLSKVRDMLSELTPEEGVVWSPFVQTEFGVFTAAVAPLVRDGKIDGYLAAAIHIGFVSALAEDIGEAFGATTFILEWPYKLVAHSNQKQLGLDALRSQEQPSPPVALVGDAVLRLFPYAELGQAFGAADKQGVEVRTIIVDDEPFVVISGTLDGYGPNPWTTGIYFPRSQVGTEVERVVISAGAGLIALIFSVLLAVWLGRRIAAPITRTAKRFQRIAALDLETVSELPRSKIREIDNGALAFNGMLNGLRAFTSYVPRTLARKLVRLGIEDAGSSRETELTVLFTDIAGFTHLSETLPAAEAVQILNRHFGFLVSCIEAEDGTVDKYLGDGLLAFWNAPDEKTDHADAAVRAALAIRQALQADNALAEKEGRPVIRVRIGIHTGKVIVGNIGALDRINYTIVGDTVNLCQRLQDLGKQAAPNEEVAILISEETKSRLSKQCPSRSLGECFVKGRQASVKVWSLEDAAKHEEVSVADLQIVENLVSDELVKPAKSEPAE